jgi:hypothetical protein
MPCFGFSLANFFVFAQERYDIEGVFEEELSVSQRDRISIDVSDIREQTEQCHDDVAMFYPSHLLQVGQGSIFVSGTKLPVKSAERSRLYE